MINTAPPIAEPFGTKSGAQNWPSGHPAAKRTARWAGFAW